MTVSCFVTANTNSTNSAKKQTFGGVEIVPNLVLVSTLMDVASYSNFPTMLL